MSSTPTRKSYPSDLTDAQWTILEPLIPAAKHGGRPREVEMREIVNAMFYINRSGCQWDMLPHDLPPQELCLRLLRPMARRRHVAKVGRCVADEGADGNRRA